MKCITHTSVTAAGELRYYITAENAGADRMGEMTKTGKSGSISHGLRESDWKMREYIAWGEYL